MVEASPAPQNGGRRHLISLHLKQRNKQTNKYNNKVSFFFSTRFTVDGKSHGSDFPLPLRVSKSELEKSPNFRIPIWEKFARGARRKEKENVITFYCCGREVLPDVWCVAST